MNDEIFEKYVKAGEIAQKIKAYALHITKPGTKLLDIATKLEELIRSYGGEPAFPVNISINEVAAHYTPKPMDAASIPENSVVKIDIGVHVDGYIADTAITISFNDKYSRLLEACEEALNKALAMVKPGIRFSEIGRIVESIIKSYGYKPIYNLSGHSLERYQIHAGQIIPNYSDMFNFGKFRDGEAYAIEPFATDGLGFVRDSEEVTIYSLIYNAKRLRRLSTQAREFYEKVYSMRRELPFALRWFNFQSMEQLNSVLRDLKRNGVLREYPVLIEKNNGKVVQFEETIVIYKNTVFITTRTIS